MCRFAVFKVVVGVRYFRQWFASAPKLHVQQKMVETLARDVWLHRYFGVWCMVASGSQKINDERRSEKKKKSRTQCAFVSKQAEHEDARERGSLCELASKWF